MVWCERGDGHVRMVTQPAAVACLDHAGRAKATRSARNERRDPMDNSAGGRWDPGAGMIFNSTQTLSCGPGCHWNHCDGGTLGNSRVRSPAER
jgi:hypothetical protein